MSSGIEKTFQVLTKSKNDAAVDVLAVGLDSAHKVVTDGAIRALSSRRGAAAESAMVSRWHDFAGRFLGAIDKRTGKLAKGLRESLLQHQADLCGNACQAFLDTAEFDLAPLLILAAEDKRHPHATLIAETVREAASAMVGGQPRTSEVVRNRALSALEESMDRFAQHRQVPLVEAFALLANRENATLKRLLESRSAAANKPLLGILREQSHPRILHLAVSFIEAHQAPRAVIEILAERHDEEFLTEFLRVIGREDVQSSAAANLKRIKSFAWLANDPQVISQLSEEHQSGAAHAVVASGMEPFAKLRLLRELVEQGAPQGRRAVFKALRQFAEPEATELLKAGLDDQDPEVQATCLSQARDRSIPGAVSRLIIALDSEHSIVREAARKELHEFNFQRYLTSFDHMEEAARISTGELVSKVDPKMEQLLKAELDTLGCNRKIRAMKVAPYLRAVDAVEEELIENLSDSDHFVRTAAATALAHASTPRGADALREALLDRSTMVQEAAEEALQLIASGKSKLSLGRGDSDADLALLRSEAVAENHLESGGDADE